MKLRSSDSRTFCIAFAAFQTKNIPNYKKATRYILYFWVPIERVPPVSLLKHIQPGWSPAPSNTPTVAALTLVDLGRLADYPALSTWDKRKV